VPRNAEIIRQWTVLREIERARGTGVTIDELATLCAVTTRTIRRDLQALEESGFPLYDDKTNDDGKTRWRVNGQAFKGLSAGLTVSELCALYFSRTLLESLSGTPFRDEVESAFEKLSSVLTPHMREFLDQLPRVIATKADPMRRHDDPRQPQFIGRALEATLQLRQAQLTYHSKSSDRTKTYLIHPYRLAYAQGALYLLAYVPEYGEVRTFAVDRMQDLSLLEARFTPIEDLPDAAFPLSLGLHSGPPERVEVEFEPAVADYVRAREWHASQRLRESASGGVALSLDVCLDRALHSWILSFGPFARVVAPASLAREIAEQFEEARARYAS
jgi:predicted DNA-binding transcriptional regulator YafY